MKREKWFHVCILAILICILFAGCALTDDPAQTDETPVHMVGNPGDEGVEDACYLYTWNANGSSMIPSGMWTVLLTGSL